MSQAVPTSVLWRRLELLGDVEHLRYLRRTLIVYRRAAPFHAAGQADQPRDRRTRNKPNRTGIQGGLDGRDPT